MADTIKIRRDIEANWNAVASTCILAEGEIGIITDKEPLQCKVGNGTTNWQNLPIQAWVGPGSITQLSGSIAEIRTNTSYVLCSSASGSAAKEVNLPDFELSTHCRLVVQMAEKNVAASPTLNVNDTGAVPLWFGGALASADNTWDDGDTLDVYYDGTVYNSVTLKGSRFGSGQQLSEVKIKDENGEEVQGTADVLSAEAGVEIKNNKINSKNALAEINGGKVITDVIDVIPTLPDSGTGEYGKIISTNGCIQTSNGAFHLDPSFRTYLIKVTKGQIISAKNLKTATDRCLYASYSEFGENKLNSTYFLSDYSEKTETSGDLEEWTIPANVAMIAFTAFVADNDCVITLMKTEDVEDGLKERVHGLENTTVKVQVSTESHPITIDNDWLSNSENATLHEGKIFNVSKSSDDSNYNTYTFYADKDGNLWLNNVGTSTTVFRILVADSESTLDEYTTKNFGSQQGSTNPLPTESTPFEVQKDDFIAICFRAGATGVSLTFSWEETKKYLPEDIIVPELEEIKQDGIVTNSQLTEQGVGYFDFTKIDSKHFNLTNHTHNGHTVTHSFGRVVLNYDYEGTVGEKLTCDVWTSPYIAIDAVQKIQGNLNMIYWLSQYPKANSAIHVNSGELVIISVPTKTDNNAEDFTIKYGSGDGSDFTYSRLSDPNLGWTRVDGIVTKKDGYDSSQTGYKTFYKTNTGGQKQLYVVDKGYAQDNIHLFTCKGADLTNFSIINFSEYPWLGEDAHVGPEHGCEIQDFTYFYADGKLIDFASLSDGEIVKCRVFRFVERTKTYAADENKKFGPEDSYIAPKIDGEGNFTLAHIHYLDAVFAPDNKISIYNKLTVKRDNTAYNRVYGGMLQVSYPYLMEMYVNNGEGTTNDIVNVDEGECSPSHGSTTTLIAKVYDASTGKYKHPGRTEFGDTLVFRGDNFVVKQKVAAISPKFYGHATCYFQWYFNRIKAYFMPVMCYLDSIKDNIHRPYDVFNEGDVIEVNYLREIFVSAEEGSD